MRQFFEKMVKNVVEGSKRIKARKQDIERIKQLEKELQEAKTASENKQTETQTTLNSQIAELQAENEALRSENNEQAQQVNALQTEVNQTVQAATLTENQYIVTLSPFRKQLFEAYLKNQKAIGSLKQRNENGKKAGLFDRIDTDNEKQNMVNLILTIAVGAMLGMRPLQIFAANQIYTAFNKSKKEAENAG